MTRWTVILSVLVTTVVVGAGPAVAQDAAEAAPLQVTVASVKGVAHKLNAAVADAKWEPLKVGDVLGEKYCVRTGLGSEVVLKLAGRGTATIRTGTKIGIGQFRQRGRGIQAKLGLKYGSINTTVDKTKGPHDLKLTTAVATMTIRGTNTDSSYNGDSGYNHQNNSGSSNSTNDQGNNQGTGNGQGTDGNGTEPGANNKNNSDTQNGDTGGGQTGGEQNALNNNGSGSGNFNNGAGSGFNTGAGGTTTNTGNPGVRALATATVRVRNSSGCAN